MSYVKGLRCRECGGETPVAPLHVCEICFGPLEVVYDYAAIRRVLTRETIAARPRNLWRYHELLPLTASRASGSIPASHRSSAPTVWRRRSGWRNSG